MVETGKAETSIWYHPSGVPFAEVLARIRASMDFEERWLKRLGPLIVVLGIANALALLWRF